MSVSAYEVGNRIAEGTIKLLMTANGGAAIATLGFAGALLGNGGAQVIDAGTLASSLISYALGVIFALASMAVLVAFLVFDGDPIVKDKPKSPQRAKRSREAAWVLGFASGGAFFVGVLLSACSLGSYTG